MRPILIVFAAAILMLGTATADVRAQGTQRAADTLMVLPFENTSDKPEFNWVGESFGLALTELLQVPGLNVITNNERKITQQRLRIPLTNIPSLATSLRLARESGATLLVTGAYNIVPEQDDTAATINITSRIIRVNEGRYLSEVIDGRQISREIVLTDALANLQTLHGQIAYQILFQRFGSTLAYSQNDFVVSATKVPGRAFEAYIKGMLTPTPEVRENYFKNAIRIYGETHTDETFADAALELGHLYMGQRRMADATAAFEQVVNSHQVCRDKAKGENRVSRCSDESFAEASFYIGLVRWQQKNYEQALGVLRPLAEDLKITSVYNMLGAIAVEAARAETKDTARSAALLNEGLAMLKTAAESAPEDPSIRFNYGLALTLQKDFVNAAEELRSAVALTPTDGEAYYLLAKALTQLNDATATDVDNQARTYLTAGNRYANLEREWLKSKSVADINLRVQQPQRKDFVSVVLSRRETQPTRAPLSSAESLLAQAREHFKNGNDEDAMAVLRRILVSEPMSAESYLILGKIHLRRGDRDQATSAFKTSLFWDNRQIDAHVALGKIYLERGECQQATTYAASALEIDSESPEANGLRRQTERCSK
jgi:tetratricopeptide (TPR) repeat protein